MTFLDYFRVLVKRLCFFINFSSSFDLCIYFPGTSFKLSFISCIYIKLLDAIFLKVDGLTLPIAPPKLL